MSIQQGKLTEGKLIPFGCESPLQVALRIANDPELFRVHVRRVILQASFRAAF